ncbi:hypothetical protein [Asticcacaulis sp. 201]|uniref:hypothetical protein n=1 Tax=Asticcacaulis sp. 201 TaxID=3028787 RepID=UPI0029170041|nr:hypothetical protein [Asticcacaulis sp. 201]MDV6332367.1 hypothetical protein [Asticcacaulis sp. 201]
MKHFLKIFLISAVAATALPVAANAATGPATQALSACLVRSASADDQVTLVRWAFAIMARHPKVADMSAISASQYVAINKAGGDLFTRLLTTDCTAETRTALQTDGQEAIQASFTALGQKALQGLLGDANVQSAIGDMLQYVDQTKLLRALTGLGR